jgi:sugar transferase (PEP-CTERM/EpsH1 system associated)
VRILFISHRFPYPPTFGSKVRAFNVIRHLGREHEVTLLSLVRSEEELQQAAGVAPFCHEHRAIRVHGMVQAAKVLATLPTTISASEAFFHSTALQREVNRQLAKRSFDFIFAHCSAVGRTVEHVRDLPKLIDFCDVDSRKWLDYVPHKPWPVSLAYRRESSLMAAAERRLATRFDQVTVATRGEVRTLAGLGIHERVDWFANGVDAEYFAPATEPFDATLISFIGRMDYFPNEQCMVEFCANTWPQLSRDRPALRLQIVGAAPTARVRALARIEGVTVTGEVADVRPYVRRSALTIAPLAIARGTQNKILESMAMGVPVVASRIAADGVDAVAGQHLLVADSPEEMRSAILRLTQDSAERARLGQAGRARVLSHHAWAAAMKRLDRIVEATARSVLPAAATAMAP